MSLRICLNSPVKGFVNKWIVIVFTQHIRHDTSVTEIQNGAQIELMYLNAFLPFELCYIGEPFFIRFFCIELAVQ